MIVVSCRGSGGSQGSLYIGFGWFWFAIGHGQSDSATISNLSSYHSRLVSSPPLRLETVVCPKFSSGVSKNGTTGFIQLS